MDRQYNVIDLFCGAGGLSYGFEQAGFNVLVGIDNDAKALETFEANHNGAKSICGDITKVHYEFPEEPCSSEEQYSTLRQIVESQVPEKYFFSEKAVQGMLNAKKDMNKGRAQDLDKPCNTVGSHLAKVSLNSTDPVLFDNGKYRRFTPREVARIQSFPESFKLVGTELAQYRALGNAISPVMFWYITRQLVKMLSENKNK